MSRFPPVAERPDRAAVRDGRLRGPPSAAAEATDRDVSASSTSCFLKQTTRSVSANPAARCTAWLSALSISASDANSAQPRLRAQPSAAAMSARATPRRRNGAATHSPSRNATGLVSQPLTGSDRSRASANPATSASTRANHAANGVRPPTRSSISRWCVATVASGQSRERQAAHRASAPWQRTRRGFIGQLAPRRGGRRLQRSAGHEPSPPLHPPIQRSGLRAHSGRQTASTTATTPPSRINTTYLSTRPMRSRAVARLAPSPSEIAPIAA